LINEFVYVFNNPHIERPSTFTVKLLYITIIAFVALGFQAKDLTQDLKEAKIKFDLVGRIWYLADKRKHNESTVLYYKRMPFDDKAKLRVIPGITIVIDVLKTEINAEEYSKSLRTNSNVEVTEEFDSKSGKFEFEDAVGYKGTYVDQFKNEHTVLVVHGVNGKKGFQFICDVFSSHFDNVESEFLKTIKTIRKK
jgi:hypothetical protein